MPGMMHSTRVRMTRSVGVICLQIVVSVMLNQFWENRPMVDWNEHIVIDPAILVGKPVIKGTRLAVEFMISLLA